VIEPESVIACEEGLVGVNELLARQRHKRRGDAGARIVRSELDDGAAMEPSALNGGSLDHGALRLREAIDSGCQERLKRRWKQDHFIVRAALDIQGPGDAR
jgi:hypothetical protein